MTSHAYQVLNNAKLGHILRRLNDSLLTALHEPISYDGPLTVEHLMPQNWIENWPLPDGSRGMTDAELSPPHYEFQAAWLTSHAYQVLNNAKLGHILRRLNDSLLTALHEPISYDGPLTVEHLMPQNWIENWPLPDGSRGMTDAELWNTDPENVTSTATASATKQRQTLVQTIGNLTLLTQPLNSAVSNSGWERKRQRILETSLLPINQRLHSASIWDEAAIEMRGKELFLAPSLMGSR